VHCSARNNSPGALLERAQQAKSRAPKSSRLPTLLSQLPTHLLRIIHGESINYIKRRAIHLISNFYPLNLGKFLDMVALSASQFAVGEVDIVEKMPPDDDNWEISK
jgi:hypothetical protein